MCCAVVTWNQVGECCTSGSNTFQVQLLENGQIIFGYAAGVRNGEHDLLFGVTPGGDDADPGSTHFLRSGSFRAATGTVYELFAAGAFDLSGLNFVFAPNGDG